MLTPACSRKIKMPETVVAKSQLWDRVAENFLVKIGFGVLGAGTCTNVDTCCEKGGENKAISRAFTQSRFWRLWFGLGVPHISHNVFVFWEFRFFQVRWALFCSAVACRGLPLRASEEGLQKSCVFTPETVRVMCACRQACNPLAISSTLAFSPSRATL